MEKRNHFTEKLLAKSNQELQVVLNSPHHVDEAKFATLWTLEARNKQKVDSPPILLK